MSLAAIARFISHHPLTRDRRLRAFSRVARWQIRCRLGPGPVVHEWVGGARFLVRAGETGLTGNIYAGLHEFEDMAFVMHVLRPGDLFVDAGANVGSYTLLASAVAGANTVAFEPVPSTFARLERNVDLNHLGARVECRCAALGAGEGEILVTEGHDTTNHVVASDERTRDVCTVQMTSLDASLGGRTPLVIKIDVEGWEMAVLQGAMTTLDRPDLGAVLVEMNGSGVRYGFDDEAVRRRLEGHGFAAAAYDPFTRQLAEGSASTRSGNVLFIRDRATLAERLRTASAVRVLDRMI